MSAAYLEPTGTARRHSRRGFRRRRAGRRRHRHADGGPRRGFRAALAGTGPALTEIFYCAESVLLPEYRGRGLGHRFFDLREAHARALGRSHCAFCSVVRPADHPVAAGGLRAARSRSGESAATNRCLALSRISLEGYRPGRETQKPLQFWMRGGLKPRLLFSGSRITAPAGSPYFAPTILTRVPGERCHEDCHRRLSHGFPRQLGRLRRQARSWVADAAGQGADLLVFPEYGALELATLSGREIGRDLEACMHARPSASRGPMRCTPASPGAWRAYPRGLGAGDRRRLVADASGEPARLFAPTGTMGVQDKQVMTRFEREELAHRARRTVAACSTPRWAASAS